MELFNELALTENIIIIAIGLILAFLIIKFVVKTLIRIILLVLVLAGALYLLYHFNIDLPPDIENAMKSIDKKL